MAERKNSCCPVCFSTNHAPCALALQHSARFSVHQELMCEPVSVQEVPPEEQEVLGVETICPLSFTFFY